MVYRLYEARLTRNLAASPPANMASRPSVAFLVLACVITHAAAGIVGPSPGAKLVINPANINHVVVKDGVISTIGKYGGEALAQCYKDFTVDERMCGMTASCTAAICPSAVFKQGGPDGKTITLAGQPNPAAYKSGPQIFTPFTGLIRSLSMTENGWGYIGGAYEYMSGTRWKDLAKCITRIGSRAAPFSISSSGSPSSGLYTQCASASVMKVSVSGGCCGGGWGLVSATAPMELTLSGENAYYGLFISRTLPPPEQGVKVALSGQNAVFSISTYNWAGELVLTGSVHGEGAKILVQRCKGLAFSVKWAGEGTPPIEINKFDCSARRRSLLAEDAVRGLPALPDMCPSMG